MPTRYQQLKDLLDLIGCVYTECNFSQADVELYRTPTSWANLPAVYATGTYYVFERNGDYCGAAYIYGIGNGTTAWDARNPL